MKRLMFAEISKTEKQDDGTIKVSGYASSEAVDSDGEVISADAMKAALPEYMKFANVREMHDAKKAAGTAIEATVQDDGRTYFAAHVVDPVAVLKVETGVYKGFSIGGKVLQKDGKVIKGLKLTEVSLVDRPANPDAIFTCFKVDGADEGEPAEKTEVPETASSQEDTNKSLYSVSKMAQLLADVAQFANYVDFESEAEKRNEAIPDKVREAAKVLASCLTELTANETAALATQDADKVEKTDKPIEKAQDDAQVSELADILKVHGLESADPLDVIKTLAKRASEQAAEIEKLKAQPAPPKGVANTLVIDKSADSGGKEYVLEPVKKSDGSVDEVATLVKASQSKPLRFA